MEGLWFISLADSVWSNDLDWRTNGFVSLLQRARGVSAADDFRCSGGDSAMKCGGDAGGGGCPLAIASRFDMATISTSSLWHVASFHACRSAVWIHLFCAMSTAVRPDSSTIVTSTFRRSRIDVECSWPCCAFHSLHNSITYHCTPSIIDDRNKRPANCYWHTYVKHLKPGCFGCWSMPEIQFVKNITRNSEKNTFTSVFEFCSTVMEQRLQHLQPSDASFALYMRQNALGSGLPSQTTLGSLQRSLQTHSWI